MMLHESEDVKWRPRQSLRRAHALAEAGVDIGELALTAWHAILDGTLLLHESPYGHDDPMHGRYAYVSDSAGLVGCG